MATIETGIASSRIDRNKNAVRVCLMVGLLAAFLGPWAFDQINVPAEYPCQPPNVRLEGDFCGLPLPGTWLLVGAASGFAYLLAGTLDFQEAARGFTFSFIVFLFVLPFFSTLILVLRARRWVWQLFNIAAWGVAAGLGLWIGLSDLQNRFWMLWGVWLYIALAVCAWILEVRWLRAANAAQ